MLVNEVKALSNLMRDYLVYLIVSTDNVYLNKSLLTKFYSHAFPKKTKRDFNLLVTDHYILPV